MNKTPLYDTHVALGGRMVEFAGWGLPVQYPSGPIAEHTAVRTAAGLFDIDHMGQIDLRGKDADAFLQHVQPHDISKMQVHDAHYSYLLYPEGSFVDDIFLYRLNSKMGDSKMGDSKMGKRDQGSRWLIAVNASNRSKDFDWLQQQAQGFEVTLTDISDACCMLALQGPAAVRILQRLVPADLSQVATRTSVESPLCGASAILGRTGYTGEDGFELYLPAEKAIECWQAILEAGKGDGLLPCGLAARDSLRFEACMPLYGHEIDDTLNPLEARLGWVIDWNKDFIGRETLLKVKAEGAQRLLVGFEMLDKAVAREHYELAVQGQVMGHVTSGMKSPTLDKFLGMGYVPRQYSGVGTEIEVMVRGQPKKAKVVKRPFYHI